ncbi:hypothetical protein [Niallia sp. Krafla_26]|uniref:hypothetical protein n=1 Tax=Niallia sp. Krafla_26 TaxID=3064703 RepID=UPI003D173E6D
MLKKGLSIEIIAEVTKLEERSSRFKEDYKKEVESEVFAEKTKGQRIMANKASVIIR